LVNIAERQPNDIRREPEICFAPDFSFFFL